MRGWGNFNKIRRIMDDLHQYWIAARASGSPMIFGPYTLQDASNQRNVLKTLLGTDDGVSAVYASSGRDNAEVNARFYLPRE